MMHLETFLMMLAGILVLVVWAGMIAIFVSIAHDYPFVPLIAYVLAVITGLAVVLKGMRSK